MAATSPESSCAPVTDHGLMSCSLVGFSTLSASAGFATGAVVVLSLAIVPVRPLTRIAMNAGGKDEEGRVFNQL